MIVKKTKSLIVCVPVADLRKKPIPGKVKTTGEKDPFQETQVIFGERVHLIEELDDWLLVSCPEQQKFSPSEGWHGYPGWVKKNQVIENKVFSLNNLIVSESYATIYDQPEGKPLFLVTLGSHLEGLRLNSWWRINFFGKGHGFIKETDVQLLAEMKKMGENEKRKSLLAYAEKFLSSPYVWGGRSFYNIDYQGITGVDCSGLVNLVYRLHGISIPRDAKDQFLKSKPTNAKEIKPGDLIFLSKDSKIYHVIIYKGDDLILESAMEPNCVREISFFERFGKPLKAIENGLKIGDSCIWLRSILMSNSNQTCVPNQA